SRRRRRGFAPTRRSVRWGWRRRPAPATGPSGARGRSSPPRRGSRRRRRRRRSGRRDERCGRGWGRRVVGRGPRWGAGRPRGGGGRGGGGGGGRVFRPVGPRGQQRGEAKDRQACPAQQGTGRARSRRVGGTHVQVLGRRRASGKGVLLIVGRAVTAGRVENVR